MANYNIVSGAKFNPYSFQELIQPFQIYGEAYSQQENALSELSTKANVWENLANEQTDQKTYNQFKRYSDDLKNEVNKLATEGLSPLTRQGLSNMRKRYSTEIIPIEQAYNARKSEMERYKKLSTDHSRRFNFNPSLTSLDSYLDNQELAFDSYSGNELAKQVSQSASNLARQIQSDPKEWRSILGYQYFEKITQNGYRPEDIMEALQKSPNAKNELTKLLDDAVTTVGVHEWSDDPVQRQQFIDQAYRDAGQGLWSAVGNTTTQHLANKAYGLHPNKGGGGDKTFDPPEFLSRDGVLRVLNKDVDLRKSIKDARFHMKEFKENNTVEAHVDEWLGRGVKNYSPQIAFHWDSAYRTNHEPNIKRIFVDELGIPEKRYDQMSMTEKEMLLNEMDKAPNDYLERKTFEVNVNDDVIKNIAGKQGNTPRVYDYDVESKKFIPTETLDLTEKDILNNISGKFIQDRTSGTLMTQINMGNGEQLIEVPLSMFSEDVIQAHNKLYTPIEELRGLSVIEYNNLLTSDPDIQSLRYELSKDLSPADRQTLGNNYNIVLKTKYPEVSDNVPLLNYILNANLQQQPLYETQVGQISSAIGMNINTSKRKD